MANAQYSSLYKAWGGNLDTALVLKVGHEVEAPGGRWKQVNALLTCLKFS